LQQHKSLASADSVSVTEETLLFSSAGRRHQLLRCFREDAQRLSVALRVLAVDADPAMSAACHFADACFAVPRCDHPRFVPTLVEICTRERVALLIPTIDTELAVLSMNTALFAAVGTRVMVSAPKVVALANNKLATATTLIAAGIPTPQTMPLADYLRDPTRLRQPVIAKPSAGSASIGIVRPQHHQELAGLNSDSYIVQELWRGCEFTVNVFFDRSGQLRCAIPHERLEVRAGEVSKGITRRMPALEDAARKLAQALPGAGGPLCFQAVVTDSGEFAVFEINARFGGGYPLAHRAGARFSQWLLEEACGLPLSANNDWKEGVTMLRYDAAVFIDG
jgi:carbamoyl-phosphate synthase large subunit